ncbi:MAG: MBL fold metallo-hydrolase [Leptospiraceae bacterium]|nr:MBL fold metallo-hydrolase [Leptospiraceae bacterium]
MKIHKYEKTPDVIEVGDNVFKVSIPQPFYADNDIYIIKSKEPAMIDSGYIQNLGLLQKSLKKIGLSLSSLKHIFYTHNHIDHISGAITMRSYSNALLYGMENMASYLGNYFTHIAYFRRAEKRLVYKAMNKQEDRNKYLDDGERAWKRVMDAYDIARASGKIDPVVKMDIELVEGDVIDIGGRLIGFLHTPGHNNWHITPYILGEGIYFTGDLVLNNISSIYAEVDGNLSDYMKSLERLSHLPIKRLLPAHGDEPQKPFKSIKALHKTLNILERGVIRRLKSSDYDLNELTLEAMGEKVKDSPYFVVALGIIHAIMLKLISQGDIKIIEVDPPYERYKWTGPIDTTEGF